MRVVSLLCLLAVVTCLACGHRPPVRARKETLMRLPAAWRRPSIHVCDDGAHVTYSVRDPGGYHVVAPTGHGPTYPDVSPPLFAPASTHLYYWGIHDDDGHKRYDLVADGVITRTAFVEPVDLTYGGGGTRWAAVGFVEPAADAAPDAPRPMAAVVDGREMGRYPAVSRAAFSPDGAHVAWLARADDGQVALIVDGSTVRRFDAAPPAEGAPRFDQLTQVRYLSDGRLLVLAPEQDGWVLWRDDERLATYTYNLIPSSTLLLAGPDTKASIVAGSLVTAELAPVAVWWERLPGGEERWRVVRDGAPIDGMVCDHYWETQPPVITPDGAHVAYVCPTPSEVGAPLGRRWVVLDGRRFGSYLETWTLGVAPDGSQVAYGAADALPIRSWRIFTNGIPRSAPEELVWRPRLSPDGAHVFWAGGNERGRRKISIDGHMVTRFDDVMYGPEFPVPNTAVWVIRRGRKISRIEAHY